MSMHSILGQRPILSRGDYQSPVLDLQQQLSRQVCPVAMTGQFDYDTELAVKSFQSKVFLKPDGVVDSRTWQALYLDGPAGQPTLRLGSNGFEVEQIQEILSIDLYYRGETDGDYGEKTQAAVKRFQQDWGLEANGVIDYRVWQCLSNV
ncbi:MAG: peptidoglycan-binding protein [Elainellaceae cyanobacterium]